MVQPLALLHTISVEKGSPFGLFTDQNDRPAISYTSTSETLTFHIPED